MADIYSNILSGTMDAYASVISKQPEYCNEGSCDHNDRYVDSDDDREFLGNECSSTTGTFSTWIF